MSSARSKHNVSKLSSSENLINLLVEKSGNSDVDVNVLVEMDTMPVAFAILIAKWSSKQLSDKEFERAIRKLEELTKDHADKKNKSKNDLSNVRIYGKK